MSEQTNQREPPAPPSAGAVFRTFLRLGLTAFGGPAMIAAISDAVVERKRWLSRAAFQDGLALTQTLPGATVMQIAAYAGLRSGGLAGAAAAYIGFGLPAFVLIAAMSSVYRMTHALPMSQDLFRGLQVIVVVIIARAVITFGSVAARGWRDIVIALAAAAALLARFSPVAVILVAGLIGIAAHRRGGGDTALAEESAEPAAATSIVRPLVVIVVVAAAALAGLYAAERRLFELALIMLRVSALAFGGGFTSVPLMLQAVVDVKGWMTTATFMDGIAMGQVTPGPIVITATFVGYQVGGLVGAITATAAIFTLPFVVLVAAVPHFDRLRRSASVRAAMRGVLASFVGLLLSVAITFALAAHWSPFHIALAAAAFAALMLKVDLLWVAAAGGVASVIYHYVGS